MKFTPALRRQMRVYYNLPSKSEHGRRMTGFMAPYRHFMWKQNELWRNVHEAQFEHLRKVYKRQWLEAFRVNSDEYIYKYNITKAAQLAHWETEMQAQEKKRIENLHLAQGRQALKKKHLDLLREFHERQFFYWYERASERLQYMSYIQYIPQSGIQEHIEKELNKYVIGSKEPYRLNFAGQMPMLEDAEGNVAQVPQNLMVNHTAEHPDASATAYIPPQGMALAEEALLQLLASAQEEELGVLGVSGSGSGGPSAGEGGSPMTPDGSGDAAAFSEALNDVLRGEEADEAEVKVARSMEETDEDREVSRRAYIDRGKTGSRAIFRPRPAGDVAGEASSAAGAGSSPTAPPVKRRKKTDKTHAVQQQFDRMAQAMQEKFFQQSGLSPSAAAGGIAEGGAAGAVVPKVGEIGSAVGRLRDRVAMPSVEEIQSTTQTSHVRMQNVLDKKYQRGKFKKGGSNPNADGEDL